MTLRPEALPPRRAYFEVPPTRHEMTDDQKTAWPPRWHLPRFAAWRGSWKTT